MPEVNVFLVSWPH